MNLEKISDKGKNPPDKQLGAKREVEPGKFRKYVEKVEEVNPDERKKRRMGQEAEQEPAGAAFQKNMPSRPNADTTAPQQQADGDFGEHYDTSGVAETGRKEDTKQVEGKKKKETTSTIGMPPEKVSKDEQAKKETFPFLEPVKKTGKKGKKTISDKALAKKRLEKTKTFTPGAKPKVKPKEALLPKKIMGKPLEGTKKSEIKEQKEKGLIPAKAAKETKKGEQKVFIPPEIVKPTQDLKKKEQTETQKPDDLQITPPTPHKLDTTQVTSTPALPPSMQTAEATRLIAHMVSQITSVVQKGETHTTITLTGQAFQGSVFFGSQIVIRESSTAQRVYNIELYGATPEARTFFENNAGKLLQVFQTKQYPFSVHRIETGHRSKYAIKRKQGTDKDKDTGA